MIRYRIRNTRTGLFIGISKRGICPQWTIEEKARLFTTKGSAVTSIRNYYRNVDHYSGNKMGIAEETVNRKSQLWDLDIDLVTVEEVSFNTSIDRIWPMVFNEGKR